MPSRAPAGLPTAPTRTRSICADLAPALKKSMLSMHPFRFFPATTSAFRSATSNVSSTFVASRTLHVDSTRREDVRRCHSVVSLQCKFFCGAETFSRHSRCKSRKGPSQSNYATFCAHDYVDHSEDWRLCERLTMFFWAVIDHRHAPATVASQRTSDETCVCIFMV